MASDLSTRGHGLSVIEKEKTGWTRSVVHCLYMGPGCSMCVLGWVACWPSAGLVQQAVGQTCLEFGGEIRASPMLGNHEPVG